MFSPFSNLAVSFIVLSNKRFSRHQVVQIIWGIRYPGRPCLFKLGARAVAPSDANAFDSRLASSDNIMLAVADDCGCHFAIGVKGI
jgi:hypothetical protein